MRRRGLSSSSVSANTMELGEREGLVQSTSAQLLPGTNQASAEQVTKLDASHELLALVPPRNGGSFRRRPMSQEISTLASMLPLKTGKETEEEDAQRKHFLKQHFGLVKNTYLNPERKQVKRWQPTVRPSTENAAASTTNSSAESSLETGNIATCTVSSALSLYTPGLGYETGFLDDSGEDEDDDSTEDFFTPEGSANKAKSRKKGRSNSRTRSATRRGKGGKGGLTAETRKRHNTIRRQPQMVVSSEHGATEDKAILMPLFPTSPLGKTESELFGLDEEEDQEDDDDFIVEDQGETGTIPHASGVFSSDEVDEELEGLGDDDEEESPTGVANGDEDCLRFKWEVVNRRPGETEERAPEDHEGQASGQRNVIVIKRTPLAV